ncbi:MAG: hypothetical protein JRI23_06220 [Deltaproteobacteria bacterium]|jgi:hypothetical protein|nr:hypothetical protein [Deltaproteobacteria bacterium]MBW2531170.1 hypothetical protein [Deltaproteobacteria bacterium]
MTLPRPHDKTSRALLLAALGLHGVGCGGDDESAAVEPPCYESQALTTAELCDLLPLACPTPSATPPVLSEAVTVAPSDALPDGVVSQRAHNNLDVVWHAGRLFFAFRTGPSHFADPQVVLYVVSTADLRSWVLETVIQLDKDLREPRFLTLGDQLLMYFARLGEITLTFNPEAMMMVEQQAGCRWTEPVEVSPLGQEGFIPWRAREVDGAGLLMGYVGGADIYELTSEGIQVYWLRTTDGHTFEPVVPDQPVVLEGGVSETDWAMLDDGSVVAVSRNEAGDADGWGSKICTAPASDLGRWTCEPDRKKYDSPLLFRHRDEVYLVGRRQVANDGYFDLEMRELSQEEQSLEYQAEYWSTPKRCALWRVDPTTRAVEYLLDLPSNGDTCFASTVALSDTQHLIFNYTSPLDDPELPWNDGQWGETYIYRTTLTLP